MRRRLTVSLLLLLFTQLRCAKQPQESRTAAQLIKETINSPRVYEVGEDEGGLGGLQLELDGKKTWPPKGPACEEYVSCCSALIADQPSQKEATELMCLLAGAHMPDCGSAQGTMSRIHTERGYQLPLSCK